ncbi:uncharacterized protein [Asterias amurensis]|uniref:uncharacterized protein n=1 Tax=Asterias amurensis TaxID=7602 RepID=UPI003AB13791
MEEDKEQHDYIALEEIPTPTSPEIPPSPSITGQSEITEEIELGEEISIENDDPKDIPEEERVRGSPSIEKETPPVENSPEDGEEHPRPGTRSIIVTPQPPENADVAEVDANENEKEAAPDKPPLTPEKPPLTPEKPPLAPSPASSMQSLSVRSASPDEDPVTIKKKGGSSQAPRFKNDVEPAEYIRPVAGGHNRAISSVHCKAMLVIMSTSIIVVFVVIGMVILQGDEEVLSDPNLKELHGEFNITNMLDNNTYSNKDSSEYRQLSGLFIQTMNDTFEISLDFKDYYNKTTISDIGQWTMDGQSTMRPSIEFKLYVKLPKLNDTLPTGYNETVVTTADTTTSSPSVPLVIYDVIDYVINATKSNSFGNFEGEMMLSLA